jgi:hypothetical protein
MPEEENGGYMDPLVKASDETWRERTTGRTTGVPNSGLEAARKLITTTPVDVTDGLSSKGVPLTAQQIFNLFYVLLTSNRSYVPMQAIEVGDEDPKPRVYMLFDHREGDLRDLRAQLYKQLHVSPKECLLDVEVGLNFHKPPTDSVPYLELEGIHRKPGTSEITAYILIQRLKILGRNEFTETEKGLLKQVFGNIDGVVLHGLEGSEEG